MSGPFEAENVAALLASALRGLVAAATEEDPATGWSEDFAHDHSVARAALAMYDEFREGR